MDQHLRFIQLRACGWSYSKIAVELKVSKPTLIKWGRQHTLEINNQRLLEEEAIREKLGFDRLSRLRQFAMILDKVEKTLEAADFNQIPTAKALEIWLKCNEQISATSNPVVLEDEADLFDPVVGSLRRWTG